MRKVVHCLLFVFVFCIVCMVSAADENGDIYKLVSILGVDINTLGYDQDLMTITLYPDGTLSFIFNGEEENATFWKLDGNNITIFVDGSEIYGTLINDMLTLTVDNDELTLKKESSAVNDPQKPVASLPTSPVPTQIKADNRRIAIVGDLINFGQYEQDGDLNNGPEPIVWQVLSVENNRALVISRYGLDRRPFDNRVTLRKLTWENSELRAWLNGYFYMNSFSESEQENIIPTILKTDDFYDSIETTDHIFLFDIHEVKTYFNSTISLRCRTAQSVFTNKAEYGEWWLRSMGYSTGFDGIYDTQYINENGTIFDSGNFALSDYFIRPAMWVELSAIQNILPSYMSDEDFEIDNDGVLWKYRGKASSLKIPEGIKVINDNAFSGCKSLKSVEIPESVNLIKKSAFEKCENIISISIAGRVTSIGEKAFSGCKSLKSINIPSSVASIGSSAFEECENLDSVVIPDQVSSIFENTFSGCKNLKSIDIPSSVTSIGSSAFENCENLISINIPDGIKSIEPKTFSGCKSLKSIDIPSSVISIGNNAFEKCSSLTSVVIPHGVRSIPAHAFSRCGSLESVTIPGSVTSIDFCAFLECRSLTSVNIPKSVTSIGDKAFSKCSSLTAVAIPNSVTSIGNEVFLGCEKLSSVLMPESIRSLGYYIFIDCDQLVLTISQSGKFKNYVTENEIKYNFAEDLREGDFNFSLNAYEDWLTCSITGYTGSDAKIVIPAFGPYGCRVTSVSIPHNTRIASVTVPSSVRKIGSFERCTNLREVNLQEGLQRIDNWAFEGCTSLQSIHIPDTVENIGGSAFGSDIHLIDINYPRDLAEINGVGNGFAPWSPFVGCTSLTDFTIPEGVKKIPSRMFDYKEYPKGYHTESPVYREVVLEKLTLPSTLEELNVTSFNLAGVKKIYLNSEIFKAEIRDYSFQYGENHAFFGDKTQDIFLPAGLNSEQFEWVKTYMILPSPSVKIHCEKGSSTWRLAEAAGLSGKLVERNNEVSPAAYLPTAEASSFDIDANGVLIKYHGTESQVTIPDNVTAIGDEAFSGCTFLESIIIPDGVSSIGDWAFEACKALTSVTIPDSVVSIGRGAFYGCNSLGTVTISSKVASIGKKAFPDSYYLKMVIIPDGDYIPSVISSEVDASTYFYVGTVTDTDPGLEISSRGKLIKYHGNASSVTIPKKHFLRARL